MPVLHIRAIELPFGTTLRDLWVVDGRLTTVPVADAATLPGRLVSPGLVDAHAHLSLDMSDGAVQWDDRAELARANAAAQLAAGVTVVRDAGLIPGGRIDHIAAPDVISCGALLCTPGRYRTELATAVEPADLVQYVRDVVDGGATWVKLIADAPGPDGNWFTAPPTYPISVVAEVVRVAHAGGARVATHVSSALVTDLVLAGVDSIEHGPLVTPELVEEMSERGTAWTPTLSTVFAKHLDPLTQGDGPIAGYLREVYAVMERSLRRAVELGVPVMAGTDERAHGSVQLEVEQLRRFGLTGAEALAAATIWPRAYLGLSSLEPEAPVDLVLFDHDPRAGHAEPVAVLLER